MQGIKLAEVLALLSTMTKYEVLCGIVMRQHIATPDPHNVYPRSTKRGHSRDANVSSQHSRTLVETGMAQATEYKNLSFHDPRVKHADDTISTFCPFLCSVSCTRSSPTTIVSSLLSCPSKQLIQSNVCCSFPISSVAQTWPSGHHVYFHVHPRHNTTVSTNHISLKLNQSHHLSS